MIKEIKPKKKTKAKKKNKWTLEEYEDYERESFNDDFETHFNNYTPDWQ